MKEQLLVTSATGKTGFVATLHLLNDGYPVRILVRSRNARATELEKRGAELIIGSLTNYNDLSNALRGVRRVYYCHPFIPNLLANTALFIRVAEEQGVEVVVNMGQWLAEFDNQKSNHTNQIKETYKLYEQAGLKVIQFIPGYFADNILFVVEFAIRFGLMIAPLGKGRNPAVSTEDLGLCIAALLKNPEPYIGKRLHPTGPTSMSGSQMAQVFSHVLGRKVRYVDMPLWMFVKGAAKSGKEFGVDMFTISQARHYFTEYQANKFDVGGPTSVVKDLTGKEPDDFETIVRRWVAHSPYTRYDFFGWLSSFLKFMTIPFQPVPSVRELERLNQ